MNSIISPINDKEQQLVTKTCPSCGTIFQTNVPSRVYDSAKCQRREKAKRHKARNATEIAFAPSEIERRNDCDYIKDPTVELLSQIANDFNEGKRTRPVVFYGSVPTPPQLPEKVYCMEQDDKTWVMLK